MLSGRGLLADVVMALSGGTPSPLRNADQALDGADHATDDTTHHSANHGTNRTGDLLTCGHALLASADDALCMRSGGRRKRDNDDGCELRLHEECPVYEMRFSTMVGGFRSNGRVDRSTNQRVQ